PLPSSPTRREVPPCGLCRMVPRTRWYTLPLAGRGGEGGAAIPLHPPPLIPPREEERRLPALGPEKPRFREQAVSVRLRAESASESSMSDFVIPPPTVVAIPVAGGGLFPVRRIFCVGRNYAEHAREMGHDP